MYLFKSTRKLHNAQYQRRNKRVKIIGGFIQILFETRFTIVETHDSRLYVFLSDIKFS